MSKLAGWWSAGPWSWANVAERGRQAAGAFGEEGPSKGSQSVGLTACLQLNTLSTTDPLGSILGNDGLCLASATAIMTAADRLPALGSDANSDAGACITRSSKWKARAECP